MSTKCRPFRRGISPNLNGLKSGSGLASGAGAAVENVTQEIRSTRFAAQTIETGKPASEGWKKAENASISRCQSNSHWFQRFSFTKRRSADCRKGTMVRPRGNREFITSSLGGLSLSEGRLEPQVPVQSTSRRCWIEWPFSRPNFRGQCRKKERRKVARGYAERTRLIDSFLKQRRIENLRLDFLWLNCTVFADAFSFAFCRGLVLGP